MPDSTSLGTALRDARRGAGLKGIELAKRLGWSQSRVSRVERGVAAISADEIRAWAEALGLDEEKAALLAAEAVGMLLAPNLELQGDMAERQRDMDALRQSMAAYGEVALACIPGLLQTHAYALHVLQTLAARSGFSGDVSAAVAQRMAKQNLLYEPSREFWFIITEAALRYPAGNAALMRAQAEHIISVMDLPNVTVSALPHDAAPELLLLSGWSLYDVPDDPQVLVELLAAEAWITGDAVNLYRAAFGALAEVSRTGAAAEAMIRATMISGR